MSAHTSGPWQILETPRDSDLIQDENGKTICEFPYGATEGEDGANAFLIAAAPELKDGLIAEHEAICECQTILAEYIVPDSGISDHECLNRLLGVLDDKRFLAKQDKASTAIAKATGAA